MPRTPGTTTFLFVSFLLLALFIPASGAQAEEPECVVILHGLGRTHRSMSTMEENLKEKGYLTWNEGYPSTDYDIETLAEIYVSKAVTFCTEANAPKVHFVTHSLGGILVRQYLSEQELPHPGRIVMLSPPNQGSELADELNGYRVFRWGTGPAGSELGTGENSVPLTLPAPGMETGIITGNWSSNPWFSDIIPGPDDGKVSVERAKLEGMDGFLVVERGHTFIMSAPEVIEQTIFFLKNGKFKETERSDEDSGKDIQALTPPPTMP